MADRMIQTIICQQIQDIKTAFTRMGGKWQCGTRGAAATSTAQGADTATLLYYGTS